jgi:hypothetical protein
MTRRIPCLVQLQGCGRHLRCSIAVRCARWALVYATALSARSGGSHRTFRPSGGPSASATRTRFPRKGGCSPSGSFPEIRRNRVKSGCWSGNLLMSRASRGAVVQIELADTQGVKHLHSLR